MPLVTLSSLTSGVYDRLEQNTAFYPSSEVVGNINDAIRTINLYTGFLRTTALLGSEPGQPIYDAPRSILCVTRVDYNGRELDFASLASLCHSRPRWISDTTATTDSPVSTWTPMGIKRILLSPAPADSQVEIKLYGVAEPVPLVNHSDTINMQAEFADMIKDLAACQCMVKCGGVVARDGMILYKQFLTRMKSLKRFRRNVNPAFRVEIDKGVGV